MSLLIDYRLQGLNFDKTVKCQILTDKGNGTYLVQESDVIKYDAVSAGMTYRVDEWVYVTIPNGDYNSTKIIISKYTEDPKDNPINYIPPLGTFVPMTENLAADLFNSGATFGILANGSDLSPELKNPGESLILNKLAEFDLTEQRLAEEIRYNEIYDTVGLSADFKTLFNSLDMQSGNYGLRLFFIEDGKNPTIADFDSSEMFGDPYAYNFYLTQSKKFDISTLGNISKIILVLYQKDNFRYYNEEQNLVKLSPQYTMLDKILRKPDNILVQNICIQFGKDIMTIADNTFELSVPGGESTKMQYDKYSENEDINTKTIYATWYNKTDDNEFIGFSDGVVDSKTNEDPDDQDRVEYDEDTYMQEYETQMAGASLGAVNGIPRLKESLQIYANAQAIEKEFKTIYVRAGTDIKTTLTNLYIFIKNNGLLNDADSQGNTILTMMSPIIQFNSDNQIVQNKGSWWNYLQQNVITNYDAADESNKESLLDLYINYLEKSDKYISHLKGEWVATESDPTAPTQPSLNVNTINTRFTASSTAWTNLKTQITNFYNFILQVSVDTNYHGDIKAYVDRSFSQISQYIKYIDQAYSSASILIANNRTQYTAFNNRLTQKDLTTFEEEYDIFQRANANKYCIYWYRKVPGATGDRWVSAGWERMEFNSNSETPGMPQVVNGKYEKRSNSPLIVHMNHDVAKDCIKAVVFYNHVAYWSNELEFINLHPPLDTTGSDLRGALYIELSDNSADSYQKYGSSLSLLNMSDSMINRELIIHYEDAESTEGDEVLAGCWIYWYIPLNATMLKADESRLTREGFSILSDYKNNNEFRDIYNKYAKLDSNGNQTHECYFKQIRIVEQGSGENKLISPDHRDTTFYHMIKPVFNPAYTQNEIVCVVNRNNIDYTATKFFTFSTFGTSGTDFTLSISPSTTQYAVEKVDAQTNNPLPLRASFSGYDGETVENPPAIITSWWGIPVPTGQINEIENNPNAEEKDQIPHGSVDYEITFNTELNDHENNCLYRVLQCEADWGLLKPELEADQTLTLKSYYPIATAAGMYYMTGPTTIVYDDMGHNPTYSNEAYRLFYRTTNDEILNLTWKIIHYKTSDRGVLRGLVKDSGENIESDLLRYLPTINKYEEKQSDGRTYITRYKLKPLTMYVDKLYAYSVVLAIDADGKCIFAQPLFITQNRYGSPMVNTWDEKLNIDEENNTILTAMVGAGYKDEENRFYGVFMGDVGNKTKNDSMKVGVYGINEGYQSFGLTVDGKAFFGKSGRGQIKIDGNDSTIRSASYDLNNGDSGMLIDLDDGFIDMKGTTEYVEADFEKLKEADKRGCANYADYKTRFGPLYKKDTTSSHIRLDVASPYFQITSAADHKIMHIADNEYYLQSDNYAAGTYDWADRKTHTTLGTGTKIDLQNGLIDAYHLKIQSKNILLDSSSNANPYFIIKDDDGCNLFYAGTNSYYLQTHEFRDKSTAEDGTITYGQGTKIDLSNNRITSYDFYIKGESSTSPYAGSYILMRNNPSPEFRIHLIDTEKKYDLDLLHISTSKFIMHSADWGEKETTTETVSYRMATVVNATGGLAVRTGPALSGYKTISYNPNGTTFKVYGSKVDSNGLTWWSLNPDNSIGQTDSQWSCEFYGERYLELSSPTTTQETTKTITGAEIDMSTGKLTFSKNKNALYIDANHAKFPIQLGESSSPVLKFGWDGSIYGGSSFAWNILANGNATFNRLNASSGVFSGINVSNANISGGYIGNATINAANITGSLKFGNESYDAKTLSFTYLYGGTGFNSTLTNVVTTNSKVNLPFKNAKDYDISVQSTADPVSCGPASAGTAHTHPIYWNGLTSTGTIRIYIGDLLTQELSMSGATGTGTVHSREISGRVLATGDITDSMVVKPT